MINFITIIFIFSIFFTISLFFIIKPAFSIDNNSYIPYSFGPSLKTSGQNFTDILHNDTLVLEKFTIGTWFKSNVSNKIGASNIVNKGGFGTEDPGTNMNYGIWLEKNGAIYGGFETETGVDFRINSTLNFIDNKWHYVLLTYNGTSLRLYIDGKQVSTKNTNGAIPDITGDQPLRIGANSLNEDKFFTGEIDEVRIWNDGLTDAELERINNNYTFTNNKNQIIYEKFGENTTSDNRLKPLEPEKTLENDGKQTGYELNESILQKVNSTLEESIPKVVNSTLEESIPKVIDGITDRIDVSQISKSPTTSNLAGPSDNTPINNQTPTTSNLAGPSPVTESSSTNGNSMTNYQNLLYAILMGIVGAAGITYMANYLIKRRKEKIEIPKSKIEETKVLSPIYSQLCSNHNAFASYLIKKGVALNESEIKLCFYYVCNIAYLKRKLYVERSGIILDDRVAEKIIYGFSEDVEREIKKALKPFNYSKIQSLVDNKDKKDDGDISFYEFSNILDNNEYTTIYNDFKEWLINLSDSRRKTLRYKNEWLSELMIIEMNEMNNVYKRWYEKSWFQKKPIVNTISQELENYLLGKYREETSYKKQDSDGRLELDNQYNYYYKRLKSLEEGQFNLKQKLYDKLKRLKDSIKAGQ